MFFHELLVQGFQPFGVVACQRLQGKVEEFVNVELAQGIFLVKALIGFLVELLVHQALFYQKTAPQIVAVTGEQGIVEIEEGK